jgi:hypothetical protein
MDNQKKNLIVSAELENIRRILEHSVESDDDYSDMAELVDDESVDTERED